MPDYRAYILAVDGQRFVWAKDFLTDHPNDAAAVDAAKQLSDEHDVELWEGCRLVARLSPDGKELSPGLVPPLLSIGEKDSIGWAPVALSKVAEFASAASSDSNLFLPRAGNPLVAETPETRTPTTLPEKSEDSRESVGKPDPGPAGWRRFLIPWSRKHEPGA
jgi:hypothetical protein